MFCSIGPLFRKNCTYAPSIKTRPSCFNLTYSSRRRGVKPQFLLTMIFWRPGNLYIDRRRASIAVARWESRVRTERRIWPMLTRATEPFGLPQAPRIPVCNLSAPAQDNILLIRTTWYGWARTRRWNPSLPATLTRYLAGLAVLTWLWMTKAHLLAQMRAASSASELNCSYSLETMCTQRGNSSTLARLRPRSKIRILGSGTPRLKRDLGYGCVCQYVTQDLSSEVLPCSCSSDNILPVFWPS